MLKLSILKNFQVRSTLPHFGFVVGTVAYVLFGAALFLRVERPNEIATRKKYLHVYEKIQTVYYENFTVTVIR